MIKTGIYKISNKEDGKIYIGQAKDIEKRWKTHKRNQYPEDKFTYEILMECDAEQINFWEIAWIASENACDPNVGYNKTLGGTSLKTIFHTEETRTKISVANMGHFVSDKTREAVSASNKIRIASTETKAKLSAALKGIKRSDKTKTKMSAAQKGLNKKLTEEHKDKLRKPCVINGIKYLCADVAADALGINVKTLRGYLTGFRKWPKKKNMSGYYIDEKLDDQGTFNT